MPARRLPWIKFWPELLEHEKFVVLSDQDAWTWACVWGKASQQKVRWRFANAEHAAGVTHRPLESVRRLIDAHLFDEREDGLWIHDWQQWQERYPSDYEGSDDDPPIDPEPSAKARRKLQKDSIEKREERREIKDPPIPPAGGKKRPARVERKSITDEDIEGLVTKHADSYGSGLAVREEIDGALNHMARYRAVDERKYVDNWLRRGLSMRRQPVQLAVVNGTAAPPVVDNTGKGIWR